MASYLALCTGLVWIAATRHLPRALSLLGSGAGVLTCLALLVALPLLAGAGPAQRTPGPVAGRYAARS